MAADQVLKRFLRQIIKEDATSVQEISLQFQDFALTIEMLADLVGRASTHGDVVRPNCDRRFSGVDAYIDSDDHHSICLSIAKRRRDSVAVARNDDEALDAAVHKGLNV